MDGGGFMRHSSAQNAMRIGLSWSWLLAAMVGQAFDRGPTRIGRIVCPVRLLGLEPGVDARLGAVECHQLGDQRAIDRRPGPPPSGAGHLGFVWTAGEAMCHVGLVGPASVIHASRTRARVVEDPRDQFFAAATRVEHVPFAAIVDFATRVAGHASLVAC